MQEQFVTLYVPGLFPHIDGKRLGQHLDFENVSGLELLLARSTCDQNNISTGRYSQLLSLFGIDSDKHALPIAPITRLADTQIRDQNYCLRADPVFVQANRDQLIMFGNAQLNVSMEEALALKESFNQLFAEDGFVLETPTPHRWYLLATS